MSEPLDPVAAGVASLLKSLRTRTGLQESRLTGTELPLDTLTGLGRVRAFVAAGDTQEQAIVRAVREAASSLEPTLSIVADVSLSLELSAAAIPEEPDLYAPDVGRRRQALLANWNRLHEVRAVRPTRRAPSPRALRLEVETEALAALATALTEAGHGDGPGQPGNAPAPDRAAGPAAGAGAVPGERAAPLPPAEKRVFGAELRKALRSRAASLEDAAQALALSPAQIARWEAGQDFPTDEQAKALDDYLTARGAIYALARKIRTKAVRARHGSAPPRLAVSSAPSLLQVFENVAAALRASLTRDESGEPQGWPHDLRRLGTRATAASTAYGLRAMLLLEGSLAPDLLPVANRLKERAGPGGGYAAQSQREPRPEVTAAVLETLRRIDGTAPLDEQLASMRTNVGDFERSRPYILCTMLEASHRLAPDSELTASLVDDLLAARRPYGDALLWPEKVEPMLISPDPSIAHTARAVRVLAQVQARGSTAQVQDALDQAAAWLVGRDLGNVSEVIDRPLGTGMETLYTRHFTAAWVVKALVSVGLPASHPAVSDAVAWVWGGYSDTAALWSWNNGDLPIWMTYDALDALRLASLASTVRPGRSAGP
jgi:transcriptional regulator with XRE-family HTH domain